MNPITSPTAMAIGNAVAFVYSLLETTGATSTLGGNKYFAGALAAITAINGIAHAFSPPTPGPLAGGLPPPAK